MAKIFKRGVVLLMGLAVLAACGDSATPTPAPSNVPIIPPTATEPSTLGQVNPASILTFWTRAPNRVRR